MQDADLAKLYGAETKQLKRQVRRNAERFPKDFMFTLTQPEYSAVRRQIGALQPGAHAKYLPCVFTEQGVAMLSSVLKSRRAAQVNIVIMRTFVKVREMVSAHKELAQKLAELERRIDSHDVRIQGIFEVIHKLMEPPQPPPDPPRSIGFKP